MDNYSEIYKSICRVCLSHSSYQNMVCLFDENSADGISCYGKYVITFANILLKSNDNLPIMMCRSCLLLLKQAIIFKYKCENSDLRLKKLMKFNDSITNNYKEIICQYTIFKHYFPEECTPNPSKTISNGNGSTKTTKTYHSAVENNKIEPKIPPLQGIDDKSNLDYDLNDLNENQDACDTDTEPKFDKLEADPNDAFLDKLEKMVCNNMDVNASLCSYKYRRVKRKGKLKHVRKNDFMCNICNKVLANRLTYDRHMQRHNGCRFMCESCGKAFPTSTELNIHQVACHGIGPYLQCNHCPYKAPRKLNLIEHIRLHTGERPYTCEKCGLTFRRRAIWRKHLIYHKEKAFQCPHCPKKFYRHCAMLAHMNNIHERLYVFMCNKCGVTYAKTMSVRRHLSEKHGIPRELQGKIVRIMKGAASELPIK